MKILARWPLALLVLILAGCSPSGPQTPVQRGRIVYMTHCVVCHNINPNLPGTQGPPIAGSSPELLRERLLHLSYPPGYKPKRNTHNMRAFPRLAGKIGDLAAYLQAAANSTGKLSGP